MTQIQNKKYDLEERTTEFSEQIITLCNKDSNNKIILPLINQLIRSATSIGANYYEANGAISRKDFKNKIHLCKKEAKETQYWLKLLMDTNTNIGLKEHYKFLLKEAYELTLIFSKIAINTHL